MAKKRPRSSGRSKLALPHFRLEVFESKLRGILGVECNRRPGAPGSDERPLSDDPGTAVKEYLIDSLMSKFDDGCSSDLKRDRSIEKFLLSEERCYWRNFFFSQDTLWIDNNYPELARAREIIYDLMGPVVDYERLARGFGWGPGASTRLTRFTGDACYKYSGKPEVTPNAYDLGIAAISANPTWKQVVDLVDGPSCVWGSRLTTVPKNYKIDRAIAIEPDLNMYVQKGFGSYLRQKLRKVGIDLDTQENNRLGAEDFSLATIDFAMASDSVSQGLVRYLFPGCYADLMSDMRSEFTVLPDKTLHRLSKVSSMGNGFTFELETMIFWALACACVPKVDRCRILVYGDDVLIPVDYAERFIELCAVAGFSTNTDKTFIDGPFRESCGMHIHSGYDISPFYIRRKVDKLPELFLLHNNLVRWVCRAALLLSNTERWAIRDLCNELRALAPSKWRKPRIPDGFGDGAFIGAFSECTPEVNADGWEYFTITVLEEKARVVMTEVPGLLVKSVTNLHKRRRVIADIWEPILSALPSSGRGRRELKISVPWSAFGR